MDFAALERDLAAGVAREPDTIVVVRGGEVLAERYAEGFDTDTLHDLRSVTKSVTSLLVGIAHERGDLPDLEAPVVEFFPEHVFEDERWSEIRVSHLLEMRSGLACDDWDRRTPGQEDRIARRRRPLEAVLSLPVTDEPGRVTRYCTAGVQLLGVVLERATGRAVPGYAAEVLFEPLGVERAVWEDFDAGTDTGGHLRLGARDLATVGELVLRGGRWGGQEVVWTWVERSTRPDHWLGDARYGLLWWSQTFRVNGEGIEVTFARGTGGQGLFVVPSLDAVVVVTGSAWKDDPPPGLAVVTFGRYVLPPLLAESE